MVGLVAFANDGGLGAQTKRLYEMIRPDKVLLVDARSFSKNKQFHPEWYDSELTTVVEGFPSNAHINAWLKDLTSVLTVENPYNFYLIHAARERGIKTVCQTNYEFCENLVAPWLPVPDLFLMPSYWKVSEMEELFGRKVMYLPPPINPDEFVEVRYHNLNTQRMIPRFLHIVGTLAFEDRNGTLDLIDSVRETKEDFELVIHSQHPLPAHYHVDHPKITYRTKNFQDIPDMYGGFDGLILPRRYGGLSLTTNEALMSGLPVMMTGISPNNLLLPEEWLVPVETGKVIHIRAAIECFSVNTHSLAKKIDTWAKDLPDKKTAVTIGMKNFSTSMLKTQYDSILR